MTLITSLLSIVAALVAALGAVLYRSGRKDAAHKADKSKLEKSEEMRHAEISVDRSRDGVIDRLRDGEF